MPDNKKIITYKEATKFSIATWLFTAWLRSHEDLSPHAVGHILSQWREGTLALILTDEVWQTVCYELTERDK